MDPFASLLPVLRSRVAVDGRTPQGGQYARMDNDVYFHTTILGKSGPIHPSFEARFLLFFNADGSHATPPIEILGELQQIHLGYDLKSLSGLLGRVDVREAARRIHAEFGVGRPSLLQWSVKESRTVPSGGVRHWGVAGILVNPSRKAGPERYDWAQLGTGFLNALDAVRDYLEMARPGGGTGPLEPR